MIRLVLRGASALVPGGRREEWLAEWRIEMEEWRVQLRGSTPKWGGVELRLALRSLAAWADAWSLRRTHRAGEGVGVAVRGAIRMLRREPAFAMGVIFTLALGIGSTTAIFSVVDGLMLRPVPFRYGERLVQGLGGQTGSMGAEQVDHWKLQRDVFETVHALSERTYVLSATEPRTVHAFGIEPALLRTLGVVPARGRGFPETGVEGERVVLLSHELWRSEFGEDSTIVGRAIRLDGEAYVVTGILPKSMRRLPTGTIDVLVPLARERGSRYSLLGVLATGLTVESGQSRANTIAARLDDEQPRAPGWSLLLTAVANDISRNDARALYALSSAVLLLLLIACANAATLLFVRGLAQRPDLVLRAALGASRRRLFGQVLTESALLALLAGLCGVLLSWWGVRLLVGLMPGRLLGMSYTPIGLDARALLFTLVLTLVTVVLFGAGPALRATRIHPTGAGRRLTATREQVRARRLAHVVQLAVATVLLAGAGLFARSFVQLLAVPAGFDPSGLLLLDLKATRSRLADASALDAFQGELEQRLRAVPGITHVSWTRGGLPGSPAFHFVANLETDDGQSHAMASRFLSYANVDTAYFATVGVSLLEGRGFIPEDASSSENPVIIDPDLAAHLWPGDRAVGRRFRLRPDQPWLTVVGVAANIRLTWPDERMGPHAVFHPVRGATLRDAQIALRTTGDPGGYTAAVRAAVYATDPDQPVASLAPVRDSMLLAVAQPRFVLILASVFAFVALMLAAIGVYGLIAFTVAQRTREIGVRLALGAESRNVALGILRSGLTLAGVGVTVGLLAVALLSRVVRVLLFGVSPLDPWALGTTAALLIVVCLVALLAPARRASRIPPATALVAD
jgi:predicted permease